MKENLLDQPSVNNTSDIVLKQNSPTDSILAIPIIIIGLSAIFGNSCVIAVLVTKSALHPLQHSSNHLLYMFSLSLSDLGSGIGFIIFSARYAMMRTLPNGIELDIGAGWKYFFLTNSLLTLLGISIDKLMYIQYPYSYERCWSRKRCLFFLICQWLLIGFLSLLPTKLFSIPKYYYAFDKNAFEFVTRHDNKPSALIIVRIIIFLALFITLIFGYTRLLCISKKLNSTTRNFTRENREVAKRSSRNLEMGSFSITWSKKGTKMIVLILVLFFMLYAPFFLIQIIRQTERSKDAIPYLLSYFVVWFAMLQTCFNVLIYSWAYKPFRKGLRDLFYIREQTTSLSSI